MGTSASYRAPDTPHWNAFVVALERQAPLERIRSELFNAGDEWADALSSAAVAEMAVYAVELYDAFPERVTQSERVDSSIMNLLTEARNESLAQGASPALALAERALGQVLVEITSAGASIAEMSTDDAAASWLKNRGASASELVTTFLGSVVDQFARHAVMREAGRLAVGPGEFGVRKSRELSDSLGSAAKEAIGEATVETPSGDAVRESWSFLVSAAFARGSRLPEVGEE